jgi:hypothetical protein
MPGLSVPISYKPFAATPWVALEEINRKICEVAGHEPGPGEGYDATRQLWEGRYESPLTFLQAADLCLECHRMAPFRWLNGNTFASCARVALAPMLAPLDEVKRTFSRAGLGHYIAGTITRDELIAMVPPVLSF